MKKIYSIVLMAAALLVGTNVKAVDVTDFAGLQKAIAGAEAGTLTSIVLSNDIDATSTISVTGGKKIELDLNGHNINSTAADANLISIENGSLSLDNSQTAGGVISGVGTFAIASLRGSNEDVANYSVLNVGEGVTLTSDGDYGVNMFQYRYWNPDAKDKKGNVVGAWVNTKYGYGMVLNVAGTIISPNGHGVWVLGNIKNTEGTNHSQINVLSTGTIIGCDVVTPLVGKTKEQGGSGAEQQVAAQVGIGAPYACSSCGLYGGGFCNYHIQGTVSGGNGIYMKGGNLNIDGGNISGTADEYWKPLYYGDGFIASGSAIVLDNNAGYCKVMTMTVTGNAVVTSETGNAIEELITSGTEKMGAEDFVIKSGTFTSGTDQNGQPHDAVVVTVPLGTEVQTEGTVSGGMFSTPVNNILHVTGETTEVVVDGKTYQIIHEESDPSKTLANSTISDNVKMDGTAATYTVAADATAKARYLELVNGATVTVEGTLIIGVEGVVIKDASKLTVKAGGRLIINAGIVTSSVDQLIVEASETNSGILVAAPGVTWNAQPLATVQFYTFAKMLGTNNYVWQRIATPLSAYKTMSDNFASLSQSTKDGQAFGSFVNKWDYNSSKWVKMDYWKDLEAFSGYAVANNSSEGGVTYNFMGNLQGGVTSDINFQKAGFNYFGNSFTAPIKIAAMLPNLASANVDQSVKLWDAAQQRYQDASAPLIALGIEGVPQYIPATQTFILNWNGGDVTAADLNYSASVWADYAELASTGSASPKPAIRRVVPSDLTVAQINVTSSTGDMDKVIMVEGSEYSEDYDAGLDIVKYMEENRLNIYVEGEKNYSTTASDDIIGKTLAIQTQNDITYTMTFSNTLGSQYAIKDMVTGIVTNMVEGAEYHFVAQANATTEARFQIVGRNNAPTAVENVEEVAANVKGIYTVLGQYVGEVDMWNILPAGIYVVDGVKIVK